jgi:hypothetical protein
MSEHIEKLRRLRILQAIARNGLAEPMTEGTILSYAREDPELSPTKTRVRKALVWLEQAGLVHLDRYKSGLFSQLWLASLTDAGRQWLQARQISDPHDGIYHPSELLVAAPDNRRGRVSSVEVLPTEIKSWLDQQLVERRFTGYSDLAQALSRQGFHISRSALGRYGKRYKDEIKQLRQSIEMAKGFADVVGDDGAAMNQTLTALTQQTLMQIVREGKYDADIKLPALVQAISQLNRADVNTRKFQIQQKARREALAEAAAKAEEGLHKQGMSTEAIDAIKRDILGIG